MSDRRAALRAKNKENNAIHKEMVSPDTNLIDEVVNESLIVSVEEELPVVEPKVETVKEIISEKKDMKIKAIGDLYAEKTKKTKLKAFNIPISLENELKAIIIILEANNVMINGAKIKEGNFIIDAIQEKINALYSNDEYQGLKEAVEQYLNAEIE